MVASTAFAAGIISQPFYAVLVLLAIVTSLAAGAWLDRIPRDRLLVRPPGPLERTAEAAASRRLQRRPDRAPSRRWHTRPRRD